MPTDRLTWNVRLATLFEMSETPSISRRSRFSLLTLLLLTAIAGLGTALFVVYRDLVPLRREVVELRKKVGYLAVSDRTQLHAISVPTDNELEWKWLVFIPEGTHYRLHVEGREVPEVGYPSAGGTINLRTPGEHVIRYVIQRDPRDGRWHGTLHGSGGSVGKYHQAWVDWKSYSSTGSGVGTSTETHPTTARVLLKRHRVTHDGQSADPPPPPSGFVVWLEPA